MHRTTGTALALTEDGGGRGSPPCMSSLGSGILSILAHSTMVQAVSHPHRSPPPTWPSTLGNRIQLLDPHTFHGGASSLVIHADRCRHHHYSKKNPSDFHKAHMPQKLLLYNLLKLCELYNNLPLVLIIYPEVTTCLLLYCYPCFSINVYNWQLI